MDFFILRDEKQPQVKKLRKKPSKFEKRIGSMSDFPQKVLLAMGLANGEILLIMFENDKGAVKRPLQSRHH